MNNTEITTETSPARQAAVKGLAVVGFIALIVLGVSLGVYSARFIPSVANRLGAAAVYIGSVFNPGSTDDDPGLPAVPPPSSTASSTIPFGNATSTPATSTPAKPVAPKPKPVAQPAPTPVVVATPAPYGLPDLTVRIIARGYQTSASPLSFVSSPSVPSGAYPAVKMLVKNIGTNYTGTWTLKASIPRDSSPATSPVGSFAPGEEREFTAFVDRVVRGSEQTITVTVNSDGTVNESNTTNNEATAVLEIQ